MAASSSGGETAGDERRARSPRPSRLRDRTSTLSGNSQRAPRAADTATAAGHALAAITTRVLAKARRHASLPQRLKESEGRGATLQGEAKRNGRARGIHPDRRTRFRTPRARVLSTGAGGRHPTGSMYPPEDLAGAESRLRDFLIGRFGGPQRIEQRGHRGYARGMRRCDRPARPRSVGGADDQGARRNGSARGCRRSPPCLFHSTAAFMINRQ